MGLSDRRRAGSQTAAKLLYGLLFVVLLPLLLVLFSARVEVDVALAPLPVPGVALAVIGLAAMLWGMWDLWRHGRGLPMNAFPPEVLVVEGIYAIVPQPIYSGAVLVSLGVSLALGSAVGVYVTTPLLALSCLALVLGYERPYLLRTFGHVPHPLLGASNVLGPAVNVLRLDRLWSGVLRSTERLANSWSARRVGSARLINHAVFAGLAGGVGAFIVVLVAGAEQVLTVCILMLAGVIGAAIVGQLLVGSTGGLSRPFGYFGGLLGIAIAGAALSAFNPSMPLVLAAFCFAGPWTQAIGRLRCIVQGCCHGAPCADDPGIVVNNVHSRVALAGLKGTRIYPTQLYSILGNAAIAAVLIWLWTAGASLSMIIGIYLALAGLVRFVEEGYRGEPLTKIVGGLHIYQWFAIGMLVVGLIAMTLPSDSAPPLGFSALIPALVVGAIFFGVCGFAMGVDFPESRRRFSRLSG